MNLFREAVSGDAPMSGETALMYARGLYYLNGGTKEGFDAFNEEDVAVMLAVDDGIRTRRVKAIKAFFGGRDRCPTRTRSL